MNVDKLLFWSDLHIGHKNIYKFNSWNKDGELMRPFNGDMYEGEKTMVHSYNSVVKDDNIVFFVGDVWFDKKRGGTLLNFMKKGSKRLVMGNHDNKGDVKEYRTYFDKVHGCLYLNKLRAIVTHMPIHPRHLNGKDGRFDYNIHGHTHDSLVYNEAGERDYRYLNCSVEVVGYKPVSFEELIEINNGL